MNLKHIWIVFKKEMKDMIRDKKTVIGTIVVPMLMIPLLNIIMGGGIENLEKGINENVTIALAENSQKPEIKALVKDEIIKRNPNIQLVDESKPMDALKNGKVRLVLEVDPDFSAKLKEMKPFTFKLSYDKSSAKSQGSVDIVGKTIGGFNQQIVEFRLKSMGLSNDILQPTNIVENNIADESKTSTSMLATFLPLLIVVFLTSGGIAAAADLVAGEKERNTLEPLLTTRPKRATILAGKYLTVTLFSIITVVTTLCGIIIGYLINPKSLTMGSSEQITGFSVEPGAMVLAILVSITLGMTFSGLQIAVSTYAKNFKEAQTFLSILMIGALALAYSTMFTQPNELPIEFFFIPVLNAIASIKMVLGGNIDYTYLLFAFGSSIIYVLIATGLAAYMFKKEKYILRG